MDLEAQFAPGALLELRNSELASHFSSLIESAAISQQDSVAALHSHIITQVHNGAIPPFIFAVWLPLALHHDSSLLRSVLLDVESRGVRHAGIKSMKRLLKGKQWKEEAWDAAGGTEGLRHIFEMFGVWESRELARVIGSSNATKNPEKAAAIDDLIQLLMPSLLPTSSSDSKPSDQQNQSRPLLPEWILLAQGCSSEFLARCLSNPRFPSHLTDRVLSKMGHQHRDLLRKVAIGSTAVTVEVRKLVLRTCLPDLITSTVPWKPEHLLPAVSPGVPPGMRFCLDLIYEARINPPPSYSLPKNVLLDHVITTVDLAIRRKVLFRDILVLLELGLSLADTREGLSIDLSDPLLVKLVHYWAFAAFPDSEPQEDLGVAPTARRRQLAHPSRPKPEHRDSVKALLLQVVKAVPEYQISYSTFNHSLRKFMLKKLERDFPSAAKLPLIKILCRHLPNICIDLDSEVPSENERLHLVWDIEVLGALPCHDAKWLFERATSMRPVEQVITSRTSPWDGLLNVDKAVYVSQLLNVKWQAEIEPLEERTNPAARKLLEDVKRKAERQRDADERLEFSQLAVDVAVISKSVKLLKEVCEWARRFLRDPIVGTSLPHDILSDKTARLISCTTSSILKSPISPAELSSLVQEGNSLLSFHLQTVLLAIREPSFKASTYGGIFYLLSCVVSQRIDGIRTRLRLELESEADLVEIFLRSLTPIILEFERAGTAEGHSRLDWARINGPLDHLDCPSSPSGPVLSFLDDLAKQRDELVNQIRIEREPKVATIGEGWPKGLPVQSLFPSKRWAVAATRNAGAAPFMTARVEKVVFCDPKTVLETVPEETDHIGPFCDSLKFAITCYVGKRSSFGRESKLLKVWDHYSKVVPPSAGHMLALGQWLSNLAVSRGCTNVSKKINSAIYPLPDLSKLPSVDGEAVEWDPWPEAHSDNASLRPSNSDRPTILRSQFHTSTWNEQMWRSFTNSPLWKTSDKPKILDIWNPTSDVRILPPATQEAIIVSALLYLDSLNTGSPRLLSNPFPEGAIRPRYPSVYLDYEFLSAIGKSPEAAEYAIKVLKRLLSIVPPTLLRDLANSLLKTLANLPNMSTKYADINSTVMGVTALLPLSDKPALAVDLGLSIIENMPDASAWHRQIISLRLGRQLGHNDAEEMMRKFASYIFDAIEKQRKGGKVQPEPEPEPESDEDIDMLSGDESDAGSQEDIEMADEMAVEKDPPAPSKASGRIKITTIKMLAQLLTEGNFTSLEFGRSTLVSLFSASHHIDVRRSVAGALLDSLRKSEDMGSTGRHAYAALVSISAAAAGPSERVRTSESQWREAENGGPLPEVDTERPLFKFFIEEIRTLLPSEYNEMYVQDVVLPLLNESSKQHNRWMRAFLSRVELTPEEKSAVDFGPFGTVDRTEIILKNWKAYLPKSYLIQHRFWALSHLNCRKLEGVNLKLTLQDLEWRNTEAGKYWTRYFTTNKTGKRFVYWSDLFERGVTTLITDGITDQDMMDEFCAEASIIIREPYTFSSLDSYSKVSLDQFNNMFMQLQTPGPNPYRRTYVSTANRQESWRSRARPVLERITADIESIRSSDSWSKNPDRRPVILPTLTRLRTRLLPYPHINLHTDLFALDEYESRKERQKRQEQFVSNILSLLDEVASFPSSLNDFKWLAESTDNIAPEDQLPFILGIGKSLEDSGDSFKDCMKVKLVEATLQKIRPGGWASMDEGQKGQKEGVKAMMEEWKKSPNEWVRLVAWNYWQEIS